MAVKWEGPRTCRLSKHLKWLAKKEKLKSSAKIKGLEMKMEWIKKNDSEDVHLASWARNWTEERNFYFTRLAWNERVF